jgi:hypothetical protein
MSLFNNNVLEEHWKLQKLGILYSTQNLKLMLQLLSWLIWVNTHLCKVVHSRGFIFTYSSIYFSQMDRHLPLQFLGEVVLHSGAINEVVGSRDKRIWEVTYTCIWSYDRQLIVYTFNRPTLFYRLCACLNISFSVFVGFFLPCCWQDFHKNSKSLLH